MVQSVSTAKIPEGKITPEALEDWKRRIGAKLRIPNIYNTLASKDSIRHCADGVGDCNPLWRDEEYAEKTRYGCIVAPPYWLYSVFPTWVLQGLPGVHAYHSGNEWEFYKPILVNDRITPECVFTGFEEKKSAFAGKMVMEYQDAYYHNQRGELVAKAKSWLVRVERAATREKGKYHKLTLPHPWKEEDLQNIEEEQIRSMENIRGAEPRYWEDVKEGEELPELIKGPFGYTDMIAYCAGSAPVQLLAFGLSARLYRAHPAWALRDPRTSAKEPIYSVHYNDFVAHSAGLPYTYDVGAQRQSFLLQFILNWIGDEGWIKRNRAEYRGFFYHSDVLWFKGKVTKKYVDENHEHCIDIETHAINQRGEDIMPGSSTVILPSRDANAWPLERRLPPFPKELRGKLFYLTSKDSGYSLDPLR